LTEGNWSDIRHLTRVMRALLGDITFQEAYNRTRRICNICVSSASVYELPRILNYVTAPNVMIWSAVAASCSVPLVFSAAQLLVRDPMTGQHIPWNPTPQMWIDGSVDNDLPMTRLAEMFNVNHFIVSQVNPHVVPFLSKDDMPNPSGAIDHEVVYRGELGWLQTLTSLAKGEAMHRMHLMAEMGIFPNLVTKLRSILSQKYSGDINIIPAIGILDLPKILRNPDTAYMLRLGLQGERATWPKLSRIKDCCAIELALDRAVHALRARVVFSKSQVNLRRMATSTWTNTYRGSYEPLTSVPMQLRAAVAKSKHRHGRRHASGSNLPLIPYSKSLFDGSPYEMSDEDTDQEESLEMSLRRPRAKSRPKMKRLPRGHPLQTGPLSNPIVPAAVSEKESFDLQSGTKDVASGHLNSSFSASHRTAVCPADSDSGADLTAAETASMTSPTRIPLDETEPETSDLPTSDADVDSHTDEDTLGISPRDGLVSIRDSWAPFEVTTTSVQYAPRKRDSSLQSRRNYGGRNEMVRLN
jgi:TAG lipase/steryl ester hydrolase/phospholipase A2/LPA acyltransferase